MNLIEEYEVNKKSVYILAKELNTYPNQIRRKLRKLGVKLRTHSDAQKVALATGRHPHPRKRQLELQKQRENNNG